MNDIQKMEKIRNLLVGDQLKDISENLNNFNERFHKNESEWSQDKGELQDSIESLRKEMQSAIELSIESLKDELLKELSQLRGTKASKTEIAEHLEIIAKSLRNSEEKFLN